MIKKPLFDHAFAVRYTVGFVFLNKYYATENHHWGGKFGIILKLGNDIHIPDENNSSMICGILKEVLLKKVDGVKYEPDLKPQRKLGGNPLLLWILKKLRSLLMQWSWG